MNGTAIAGRARDDRKGAIGANAMQKLLAFVSLVVLLLIFSLASPNFFQAENLVAIMLATAVNGVLAIGVTFVIVTSGIDLSIGTLMTFCSVMAGVFLTYWRLPIWVGVLGALASGAFIGATSGFLVSKLKIPAFIATLGMLNVTKGLSLIISRLKPIYFNDSPGFYDIAMGSIISLPGFEIPNAVLILFALAVVMSFVLNNTVLGRYAFALGSNEEAARLSGVNVDRWKIAIYSLCGLVCGIAGVLMGSRLNSAQPALGQGYELDAIAATVIGGTSLSGGEGTILGTIIGAFIMSVLTNGLRILSVPQEWQTVVTGVIIIGAVLMDILRRKK